MLSRLQLFFLTLVLASSPTLTASASSPTSGADTAQAAAEPLAAGFRADYLMEIARLRERTLGLAGEIPPEKYAQAVGGHSLAECLTGLAAASRRVLRGMAHEVPPAGRREQPVDKADVASEARGRDAIVEDLTVTLDAVRRAVEVTPDEGLAAPIDFLGRRWTVRALFLLLLGQTHEGLGHAAAHAESLGIVPPWERQKRSANASED